MKRGSLTALIVALAVLLGLGFSSARGASPLLAKATAEPGVDGLWKEYPLEEGKALPDAKGGVATDANGTATPQAGKGAARSPAAPASGKRTPQSTQSTPRDQASQNGGASGGGGLKIGWIVGVILLLVIVDVIVFLRVRRARRTRRRAAEHPVWGQSSNVYAEGATDRDGIGAFRGFVHAMGSATGPGVDRMLLVRDPAREEPIWVRRSEVVTLSTGEPGAAVPATVAAKPASKVKAPASAPASTS